VKHTTRSFAFKVIYALLARAERRSMRRKCTDVIARPAGHTPGQSKRSSITSFCPTVSRSR